jgi:hypothetical protein
MISKSSEFVQKPGKQTMKMWSSLFDNTHEEYEQNKALEAPLRIISKVKHGMWVAFRSG